jgi:diguanylate cyclase (GGDEF)-like protein/PAS domain S-box-containing protein
VAPPPDGAEAGQDWLDRCGSLRGLFEASGEWISILDTQGRILFANESGRKVSAISELSCLPGGDWLGLWAKEGRSEAADALEAAAAGRSARITARLSTSEGEFRWWDVGLSPLPGADGAPSRVAVIARDVTERKLSEAQFQWAAHHDPLTELPNRMLFQQYLEQEVATAGVSPTSLALLLVHLDGFKWVNQTLGLEAQDALMCEIASRLRAGMRRNDFVARFADDEFALILHGVPGDDQLEATAEAIFGRLNAPLFLDGRRLECPATIGASIFPQHGPGAQDLLKNADTALHSAKRTGRGTLRVFESAMRSEMQRRDSMLSLAKYVLREERIVPYYQPKVDLRDGTLYGFEALLRWRHPTMEVQLPDTIQAAFQDDRLAAAISDRMIRLVLRDMRHWMDQGIEFGHVAVNAAAAEFGRGDFAERLLGQLRLAGIPPSLLQLEVTETVFLGHGAEHVVRALKAMSAAGIQIALDDFGTGYASLSHLKQFPVSTIKIDRSFVRDLHKDAGDEAIVRAIVSLGRSLGVNVVAEGIETPAQSAYLRKHLCAYGQGYLFGAAACAAAVPAMIEEFDRQARGRLSNGPSSDAGVPALAGGPGTCPIHGNIYIVEDDPEVRDATRFMLKSMGYRCRTFASGADFLATVLQLEPGCILLDIRMGGLSGLQVLRELKWMSLAWPVVAVSGKLDSSLAGTAKAAGAFALVAKPFDESELLRTIADASRAAGFDQGESRRAAA